MKLYDKAICKLLKQFMTYLEKKALLSNWKKVNAVPICKTESRGLIWKYSPVLLFRIFAEIFELYIYNEIYLHLINKELTPISNRVLSINQFLSILLKIYNSFSNGFEVCKVFFKEKMHLVMYGNII